MGKRLDEHGENFNRELESIKENNSEMKNTITEMKNTLEGIKSQLGNTEEHINKLEDTIVEITRLKHEKENKFEKMRLVERTSGTTSSVLIFAL